MSISGALPIVAMVAVPVVVFFLLARALIREKERYGSSLALKPSAFGAYRNLSYLILFVVIWFGVAAAIQPFLKRPFESCLLPDALMIMLISLLLAGLIYQLRNRTAGGDVLLDIRPAGNYSLLLIFGGFFVLGGLANAIHAVIRGNPDPFPTIEVMLAIAIGGNLLLAATNRLQARENGLFIYGYLLPWSNIKNYEWSESDEHLLIVHSTAYNARSRGGRVPIPADRKAEVDAILRERVPAETTEALQHSHVVPWVIILLIICVMSSAWVLVTEHPDSVMAAANGRLHFLEFSEDGQLLAGALENVVVIWQCQTGELDRVLSISRSRITSLAFRRNLVAVGKHDGSIELWQLPQGVVSTTLEAHAGQVAAIEFLPDGNHLASIGDDHTLRLWNLQTGELEREFDQLGRETLSISSSNLIAVEDSKGVKLIDMTAGEDELALAGDTSGPMCLGFTPDGTKLVIARTGVNLGVWSVENGRSLLDFDLRENNADFISISPDGRLLATCSNQPQFELWEMTSGKLIRTVKTYAPQINLVRFGPDGRLAVAGSEGRVTIWSVD